MKDMQNWQAGREAKYDMETFDEVLVEHTNGAMDKAKKDGKAVSERPRLSGGPAMSKPALRAHSFASR
jgi:hypothetical protein